MILALKISSLRPPRTERWAHGGFPRPRQPWEMNGLTASHPASAMALAWRHLCRAPLMAAAEAALRTLAPQTTLPVQSAPRTGRAFLGAPHWPQGLGGRERAPHSGTVCPGLTTPTTAGGPTGHIEGPLTNEALRWLHQS